MDCSMPGFPVHHQLLEFTKPMSIESVMPSNYLILCRPLLLTPSIFPCIRVFSNESVLHIRWPKYWSFSISPSNECSGLISFRMDWLDFLAVQGTLKSLLQHRSSKASILRHSAFFLIDKTDGFYAWACAPGYTEVRQKDLCSYKNNSPKFSVLYVALKRKHRCLSLP